ncbi:MAG: tetratricopeptide repeat protein [Verrucomicrobia bacterium]|nr:tetratricopeptide repeat protein [Verrucomicrobiota bacterium]
MSTASKRVSPKPVSTGHVAGTFRREFFIIAALAIVTFVLFWPIRQHDFINYDDPDYITANPIVQQGVTWEGTKWAFTSSHSYNWHPITWVSHMLDVQFFGLNPGQHHLANLSWHVANALLLFWLLRRMTGAIWPSALVAAFFAWHPLHVESVVWACERKDVLSTFFWLLTTIFYVRFVEKSKVQRSQFKGDYALALFFFALGLMSKPMLVTLPFTLLLLDYWPLRRFPENRRGSEYRLPNTEHFFRLVWEKLPFFALTIASCVITFLVQRKEGAVVNFEHLPIGARLANAIVSYVRYIGKTLAPSDLIIYYQPVEWSSAQVALALGLIAAISVGAFWLARKQPFIFVGWCWFLGTLVPVIGIVQVGAQAIADRYMYVPMIGLSIFLIWPFAGFVRQKKKFAPLASVVAAIVLIACLFASSKQIGHWQNSEAIFARTISVDPVNVVGRVMLANTLLEQQRFAEAEEQFKGALNVNPNFPEVHFNLGNLFIQQNRVAEAIGAYEAAIGQNPNYAEAHANLGVALGMQQRFSEAVAHYERSLELQPFQPDLLRNLALDLMSLQRFVQAEAKLRRALELDPSDAMSHLLLGNVHWAQGQTGEAIPQYRRALELRPDFPEARERLMALQDERSEQITK